MEINHNHPFVPFYQGQKVIAVDALHNSKFINGQVYTVASCQSKYNKGYGPFCYVGIVGHDNGGCYFRASIFAPYEEIKASIMSFEEIKKAEPIEILINN